jgi:hypothetical protein
MMTEVPHPWRRKEGVFEGLLPPLDKMTTQRCLSFKWSDGRVKERCLLAWIFPFLVFLKGWLLASDGKT